MFKACCEQVPKEATFEGEVEEQASLLPLMHGHHRTMRTVPPLKDGGLEVLQEVLHAEGSGPDLGLDVLEERAPSKVVDLLLEHDFTDWNCHSSNSPAGAGRGQRR